MSSRTPKRAAPIASEARRFCTPTGECECGLQLAAMARHPRRAIDGLGDRRGPEDYEHLAERG